MNFLPYQREQVLPDRQQKKIQADSYSKFAVLADGAAACEDGLQRHLLNEKQAEIFGANCITEYMLYSHPFSVSPTSGLLYTAPFASSTEICI